MNSYHKKDQHFLFIGYGAVAQTLVEILQKKCNIRKSDIKIISPNFEEELVALKNGLTFLNVEITEQNINRVVLPLLGEGVFLINLSVNVSTIKLIQLCQSIGAHYIDTCIEPWPGEYGSPKNPMGLTNYHLRELALNLNFGRKNFPTAIVAHGANPGLVTHFAKAGLIELASIKKITSWTSWGDLARLLDIRVIQIAERDTQISEKHTCDDGFYNTWSVDGFLAEALQYAELGWGTHEKFLPASSSKYCSGDAAAIYLNKHSVDVQVRSWVPSVGPQNAYVITHHEAISIASLLTDTYSDGSIRYRPTVYYAYHPSPITYKSIQRWKNSKFETPKIKKVLRQELTDGFDQLGVLFVFPGGAYWYGSTLTLKEAKQIEDYSNATTIQVAAGIIGAIEWAKKHPNEGVIEAETMDFGEILSVAKPYLGDVSGFLSDWQPGKGCELMWGDFLI